MEENQAIEAGNEAQDTATATPETPEQPTAAEEGNGEPKAEPSLTPEKVNEIIRERLERQLKGIYERYGVADGKGLDDIFERAKGIEALQAERDKLSEELGQTRERLLFITNGIAPDREDDVKTYFRGKGIEMSEEALKQCISTHPEWVGRQQPKKVIRPQPIGNAEAGGKRELTDREEAERMFGMKFID